MSARRTITAALVALLLGACAKSQQPLPNKNTNWLDRCESDDDCGAALECRCGVCTVTCESDAMCGEVDDRRALCWHERSEELSARCDAPTGMDAICIPPEMVRLVDECPSPGSCSTLIAEGLQLPGALNVDEHRVYWLERDSADYGGSNASADGALKSARHDGGDVIAHLSELRADGNLVLDSTHAYFTHAGVRLGSYSILSRVPLAGGEIEHIYEALYGDFYGVALVGQRVLFICLGAGHGGIYAAPNDSSLYTNPLLVPTKAETVTEEVDPYPHGLVAVEDALYWNNGNTVRRVLMEGDGEVTELASSNGVDALAAEDPIDFDFTGPIVRSGEQLFWLWNDGRGSGGLATVDLAGTQQVQRIEDPRPVVPSALAADATHVYWAHQLEASSEATVVRTDLASHETEELAVLENAGIVLIALSEEHVFVASGTFEELRDGYIMRFSK